MSDPLKPSPQVLIALGSLVMHYEEYMSPKGHPNDKDAIDTLRNQPEVKEWFDQMDKMAFLPVKR
jgi:hypothetical protein